jgi:hypothetical protein
MIETAITVKQIIVIENFPQVKVIVRLLSLAVR